MAIGALAKMDSAYVSRIIEITPEMNRRVLAERRKEPRERIADLEKRLARILQLAVGDYEGSIQDAMVEIRGLARGTDPLEDAQRLARGPWV